jgi:hypothetical protein
MELMKSSIQTWILRTVFCTLLITGAATVQAQTDAPVSNSEQRAPLSQVYLQQITSSAAKFRLHFTNPGQGKVVLMITDSEGNTLLKKNIAHTNFAQTFDLSMLKDGMYTFTLLKGKDVINKIVQLNTDYVMVKKAFIR